MRNTSGCLGRPIWINQVAHVSLDTWATWLIQIMFTNSLNNKLISVYKKTTPLFSREVVQ